jgi:hypothetical protein
MLFANEWFPKKILFIIAIQSIDPLTRKESTVGETFVTHFKRVGVGNISNFGLLLSKDLHNPLV